MNIYIYIYIYILVPVYLCVKVNAKIVENSCFGPFIL